MSYLVLVCCLNRWYLFLLFGFVQVILSPLRKCCESSDLGGLVLVQDTQLGRSSSLPTSPADQNIPGPQPQPLPSHKRCIASPHPVDCINPFLLLITHKLNCSRAFLVFDGQSVSLIYVSCLSDRTRKMWWKRMQRAVHLRCVCGRVYFSWREPIGC